MKPIYSSTLFVVVMNALGKKGLKITEEEKHLIPQALEPEIKKAEIQLVESAQLITIMKQLYDALSLADPEKIKKGLENLRGNIDSTILKNLETQINDYDYDKALETLKEIAESIGSKLG